MGAKKYSMTLVKDVKAEFVQGHWTYVGTTAK